MNEQHGESDSPVAKLVWDSERCAASKSLNGDATSFGCLQVVVKRLGAGSGDISFSIDSNSTVLDLKKQLALELEAVNDSVPTSRHRLMYFGKMLRDDNERLFGDTGVNMKADSINYVHFSPLPKGAKPSARTSEKESSLDAQVELESRMDRARRLGTARRERRRRRRPEPYAMLPSRVSNPSMVTEPEQETRPEVQVPDTSIHQVSPHNHLLASVPDAVSSPAIQHLPAAFAQPPITVAASPLTQMSQLSATIAAATRQAEATTSWLNSRLLDHDRQAAAEIVPSLSLLHSRLRLFDGSSGALGDEESNMLETLQLLDHVSRETSNLSNYLRASLIARRNLSAAMVPTNQVSLSATLEQLLRENARSLLFSDEHPMSSLENIQRML